MCWWLIDPPLRGRMRVGGRTVGGPVLGRLSEVGTKETIPMKTSAPICTILFLAGLCLGSAVNAMAQSVQGGGIIDAPDAPPFFTIEVSARSGPAGIVRLGDPPAFMLAEVIDLCIPESPGNEAIIIAQISHSQGGLFPVGQIILLAVRDNGNTDDQVVFFPIFS